MNHASGDGSSLSKVIPLGNEAFLKALFGDRWEEAHVCAVAGDPRKAAPGDWAGGRARSWVKHLGPGTNNYYAVSIFAGDRRLEDQFQALWVLGIDDVGPKLDPQAVFDLLGEPTYRIETSPGNEQWGYRLATPITHVGVAKALQRAVRVKLTGPDGKDPGQEQVTRYMRLPAGVNLKRAGWRTRHASWSVRTVTVDELAAWRERLGVPGDQDPSWSPEQTRKPASFAAGMGEIEDDLLVKAMRELGLILGDARDSSMGKGFDVRCPWEDEHTDRTDSGTFFAPGRGFRCHHGHCDGRGLPDLPGQLDEMLKAEKYLNGRGCLASFAFDDIELSQLPPEAAGRPPMRRHAGGDGYDLSEPAITAAFADEFKGRARFNWDNGTWLFWQPDRRQWVEDKSRCAYVLADRFLARVRLSLAETPKLARKFEKNAHVESIERAARADPRVASNLTAWDQDPGALAAAGLHVDLRTGSVRALVPGDMIMRSTLVAPDPDMATPLWDGFLWETFGGDIELIEFIHQWFGYGLTGDMSAELMAFLYGTGGNGKGVLVHTVAALAGSYALRVNAEMFMQRKFAEHPTEIAQLCGARMVIGSEVEDQAHWNLARLKELTGNEGTLSARHMRRDYFEFRPTHKLTLVGNHKPAIGHVDRAIARRLLLIPFEHEPKVVDPALKQHLVPEYPGILWKLIEGAGQVLTVLGAGKDLWSLVPQSVVLASREYLVDEDNVALWLKERCETAGGVQGVLTSEAFQDHEAWCAAESRPLSVGPRKFNEAVVRAAGIAGMRITKVHREKGRMLMGIRLKPIPQG